MNSLRAFLFRSVSQRLPNFLAAAGGAKPWWCPISRLIQPHFGRHASFESQSTRPSTESGKKPRAGKKPELTKEEQEKRKKENEKKRKRIVNKFNKFIGKRELKDWQKLCRTIGLEGQFDDVESCRKAIESVYVNILDVLDSDKIIQAGGKSKPQRFPTPRALTDYTMKSKRIFPRDEVTENQPEYSMLRHIFNPQLEEKLQKEKEERSARKEEAKLKKRKDAKVKREEEMLKGEKGKKQTETGST
ncbi:hypothetical protein QBC45DRAFT_340240 [Copromyces sp. CBS 386.78]|nr:hypothetical protein QBC45DRAFT_340240 [Copromyces sp. CBS 386.78]